ncbi:MAG TPA: hypothetical protein VF704_13995 [Allosphingosinicella sp.]
MERTGFSDRYAAVRTREKHVRIGISLTGLIILLIILWLLFGR